MTNSQTGPLSGTRATHRPELSVVIPVFNENHGIESLLNDWVAMLSEESIDYELVIVNDGSLDGTARTLDRLRQSNPKLRVIHQLNTGHSRALRRGYEAARGKYILQADAGGGYEPIDAKRMWEARVPYQLVLGARTHRLDSIVRRAFSLALKKMLRLFFSLSIEDSNIPFRLFRRDTGIAILSKIPKDTPAVNLLMTVHFAREFPSGIKQIDVPFRKRLGIARKTRFVRLYNFGVAAAKDLVRLKLTTANSGNQKVLPQPV